MSCAWDVNGHLRPTSLADVAAIFTSLACNLKNRVINSHLSTLIQMINNIKLMQVNNGFYNGA